MHTIFIYEHSPGRLTLSFVKSDYVRDNALTAILSIVAEDGELHPVAFHSRSFSPMCKGNPLMPRLSVSDSASAPDASSAFRCVVRLQMHPPPSDVSSASKCVFRFATRLPPSDLSPAPPPTMVLSSACLLTASPGCQDFHRHPATFCNVLPSPLTIPLGIRRTAMSSAVPLHIPATPLAFRRSAASSGCTTVSPATPLCLPAAPLSQPAARCRMMSRDAVPPTCHLAQPAFCLYHTGALCGVVPYTYLLISDLFSISITLYIRPCLQADPYPFLFGSPARCVSCLD